MKQPSQPSINIVLFLGILIPILFVITLVIVLISYFRWKDKRELDEIFDRERHLLDDFDSGSNKEEKKLAEGIV